MSEALQYKILGIIDTATCRISANPHLFFAQLLSHEIVGKLLLPVLHPAQSQVSKLQTVCQRLKITTDFQRNGTEDPNDVVETSLKRDYAL